MKEGKIEPHKERSFDEIVAAARAAMLKQRQSTKKKSPIQYQGPRAFIK